eukprot:scaffold307677_cov47-Attheya_sp.AAC.1
MFSVNPVVNQWMMEQMRKSKKAKKNDDDDDEKMNAIFPTVQEPGPLMYGVAYESFQFSPIYSDRWWKEINPKDLVGEYDILYIGFDAFMARYHQQEGLYEEESLCLDRSMKGSLTLTENKDGELCGSVEYKEKSGTLVPSNGAFSFVEDKRNAMMIEYKVEEKFCWKDVGTNTNPEGSIKVVNRWGGLGLDRGDDASFSPHVKMRFNGRYALKGTVLFNQEGQTTAQAKAKERMTQYEDIESSWLCNKLKMPTKVARTVRSFLYPPPMLVIEEGDLVLNTCWDNRSNTTYTIARRRQEHQS